jgi:glycosyltransferase involved in cell wall biosynthesis
LYEGFGSPVLEAMKCGAAVVTSATSSLPEVIGDAGILIDPRDENSLREALDKIYNDTPMRGRMASRSLERSREFSWTICVEQHLAAFGRALANLPIQHE